MIEIEGHTFIPEWLTPESVVLDIGGNHGNFSLEILNRFNCYVECFEPDLDGFLYISHRLLHEKFVVHHRAVAGETGVRNFFRAGAISGGNSILPNHDEYAKQGENATTLPVFVLSLESILRRLPRIDLLKLDCEGSEIEIIERTSDQALSKIGQITIEFHKFCFPDMTVDKIDGARHRLSQLGFTESPVKDPTNYDDRHFFRS